MCVAQRYRVIFEGAAERILIANIQTKEFLYANPAICKMLGYTKEELIGMILKEIASIKDMLKESFAFVLRGSKSGCGYDISHLPARLRQTSP
jgi:PAS domain S-box-containing protein